MESEPTPPIGPDGRFYFSYRRPEPPPAGAVEVTLEEAEKHLLSRLETGDPVESMWELAQFYKQTGKVERAGVLFESLLNKVDDLETKAQITLALGQTAEKARDYDLAIQFYKRALTLEPCTQLIWYFIHNNLGYSLNQLDRFAEGEDYCRRALRISDKLPNAFKNLGLSLVGQGRFQEAAKCFIAATQADASDPRSTKHLEELLAEHPELEFEFEQYLLSCRAAVEAVRKMTEEKRRPLR